MKTVMQVFMPREETRLHMCELAMKDKLVKATSSANRTFFVRDSAIEKVIAETKAGSFSCYISFSFTKKELESFRYFMIIPLSFLRLKGNECGVTLSLAFDDDALMALKNKLPLEIHGKQRREIMGVMRDLDEVAAPLSVAEQIFSRTSNVEMRPIENRSIPDPLCWILPKSSVICRRPRWEDQGFCKTGGNLMMVDSTEGMEFARCVPPDLNLKDSSLMVSSMLRSEIISHTTRENFFFRPILELKNTDHALFIEEQERIVGLVADHHVLKGGS